MNLDLNSLKTKLHNRQRYVAQTQGYIPAAVILHIFQKTNQPHILFTKRTQKVEHHKGQISLPGGARDPEDDNLWATALRENQEEMGIEPKDVTLLGTLDDVTTNTGFIITPFLTSLPYPYPFVPFPEEIQEVIEAPIPNLIASKHPWPTPTDRPKKSGTRIAFEYNGHNIWGATAQIIDQFLQLCEP